MKVQHNVSHICYCITSLDYGGAEKLVLSLASGLLKKSYNISIIVLFGSSPLLSQWPQLVKYVYCLNTKFKWDVRIIWKIYKIIKKINPDIIHFHLIHATLYGLIAAWLAKIKKCVITEHNISNWQRKYWLIHKLYQLLSPIKTQYITVSNAIRNRMVAAMLQPNQIRVIYNGIRMEELIKFKAAHLSRDYVIGSIGRLDSRKGYHILLRAIKEVIKTKPNVKLEIIGDGQEKENLIALRKKYKLTKQHISFLGEKACPHKFFNNWNLYIQPSLSEGLGIAIIEAMTASLPVIASNVDGIPEIIEPSETGILVPPGDAKALRDAILNVVENPDYAAQMGKKSRYAVKQNFSYEKMIENHLILYNDML